MKNIEVELRARIDDLDAFTKKLKRYGAKFVSLAHLCDIYFCNRSAKRIEDVEMNIVGSYSLRLRTSTKGEGHRVTLNTKTITSYNDHNAWEEHEIEVNDFYEAARILVTTEFKPFFKLEKTRHTYHLDSFEICVEDIIDFGGVVEVEIMCRQGEEKKSKEKIRLFLQKMGISGEKIVPKSITNIIMKKRAFIKEIVL